MTRDEPKMHLLTAWAVSGVEVARAWHRLLDGTWEPVVPMSREEPKQEDPARVQVPMRSTGAERLVVAMMAAKAVGAKGSRHSAADTGQPEMGGTRERSKVI